MRVFVAGASGEIGTRLVPQLIDADHEVIGTSTSAAGAERVSRLGAEAIVPDLLDREAVRRAVLESAPDAIVHQATAIRGVTFSKSLDSSFAATNRLRRDGTDALLAAAWEANVPRLVSQSFASMRYAREGGPVKNEDAPLESNPVDGMSETADAMNYLDRAVVAARGIVLRYGMFYGGDSDGLVWPGRKRQFPIVGDGGGYGSFIHLDDAAAATVLALEQNDGAGVYNIVDDEPAPVREWLPVLAEALGAKPPRRCPVWLARRFACDAGVMRGTNARAASNAKAKTELGWTLRYPSWRQGFAAVYASAATSVEPPRASQPEGRRTAPATR